MSTEVWRRMMGHSLVVAAWLLYQGVTPMVPNAPTEGAALVQTYKTMDECLKAASTKWSIRQARVIRGQPAMETFACLPEGADPARAYFE